MRKIFFLILLIKSITLTAQSGKVYYIKKMNSDIVKDSTKTDEVKKYLNFVTKTNKNLKDIKYLLKFKLSESNFQVINRLEIDKKSYKRLASNLGGGRGVFYTNLKTKQVLQKANGYGEIFLINSKISNYKWKITKEKKLINGKKCYKAILEKTKESKAKFETYAWFSPELPFNFGPIGYGNLPGLILELHLNNGFSFYATEITLNIKGIKIKKPIKGKKVTREEFEKIGKETMGRMKKGKY